MKKEKQKDERIDRYALCLRRRFWRGALLTGCGAAKEDNLSQGIALVEQMDYEGALTCFEAGSPE